MMDETDRPVRVNIGCGMIPTPGWVNYDGSISVKLSRSKSLTAILAKLGLIGQAQIAFMELVSGTEISWADATKHIPHADGTVDVLCASHMIEHLDPTQAPSFLSEARRVLRSGGTLRLVVPDLGQLISEYTKTGDADLFMQRTGLPRKALRSTKDRLAILTVGDPGHKWMYDEASLRRLLSQHGFTGIRRRDPGDSGIAHPGELDLWERAHESLYMEAIHP